MAILKQSTVYIRTFRMVTSASHYVALTGATPTVNISKNGASFAAAGGAVAKFLKGRSANQA